MAAVTPGPKRGKAFLTRVINRVWEAGQHAPSREDFELTGIVLQLLGQRLRHLSGVTFNDLGLLAVSNPLDLACTAAYGCTFAKWQKRNADRKFSTERELSRLVPDYDPLMDKAPQIRRPEPFSGNMYAMPLRKVGEKQEPLRKVPREGKAAG